MDLGVWRCGRFLTVPGSVVRIKTKFFGAFVSGGAPAMEIDFRRVVDEAPMAILCADAGGVLTYANGAACAVLGREAEELVGRPRLGVFAPEERQSAAEAWERLRRGERLQGVEKTVVRKDGRRVVVIYDAVPRFDAEGQFQGAWAFVRAASGTESALVARARVAEERYRDLINNLPCVVYEVEPAWPPRYLFVSENVERFTGYTAEDFCRDGSVALATIHPEDRARVVEKAGRATFRPVPYWVEYRVVHRHTSAVIHTHAISLPILEAGRVVRRRGIILDVTEEKRLERELVRSQRLATIGRIATMMAHEIRNPLAGISLAVRALRQRPEEATHQECLDDIEACLRRIDDTIERTLNFARARPFQARRCRIEAVIENVKRLASTYVRKSDAQWEGAIEDGIPEIVADPEQLALALLNLVLNACKAMPSGGRLSVRARGDGQRVVVEVGDTGIGIRPEDLDRIFDPFYSGFGEGAGLGLPLTRRIVEAHGGAIRASSRVGQGTVFTIELPTEPPDAQRPGH